MKIGPFYCLHNSDVISFIAMTPAQVASRYSSFESEALKKLTTEAV